jgi:hypothetical protein
VCWSVPYLVLGRILQFLILLTRGDRAKEVEILALRHQVAVLRRRVKRPDLGDGDRVLLAALSRLLPRRSWDIFFVTPDHGTSAIRAARRRETGKRSDQQTHHNQHRPHRSLHGAAPLKPLPEPVDLGQCRVRKQARVGGLINEYRLVA